MNRGYALVVAGILTLWSVGCGGGDSPAAPVPPPAPAPVAPSIGTQPASQTVTAGQTASFTVAATGTAPVSYQWQRGGAAIAGATSPTYTTPATTAGDDGAQFQVVVSNVAGSATSSAATLTVLVPAAITTHPSNQTVTEGQAATFTVAATGKAPLSYQWEKNGAAISGATSSTYTTPATVAADSGSQFRVVVSNADGSATSSGATLTVLVPPAITTQPSDQTVSAGQAATFTIAASGSSPLSYQWHKNGNAISGATASSYTTPPVTTADNGAQFHAVVRNAAGSATSAAATLHVLLEISTNSLPNGPRRVAYSAPVQAGGGTPPYTWSLFGGSIPDGLSLASTIGSISGTPTVEGLFTFIVEVRDSAGASDSSTFSINITPPPPPSINVGAPASGETLAGPMTVLGTASSVLGLSSVQVAVDGGSFTNVNGAGNWTFPLDTTSLSEGPHTLTARATDTEGTTTTTTPMTFHVNNDGGCTLFASSSGNNNNSGTDPGAPKTFQGAAQAALPGAIICVMGGNYNWTGNFYPPRSGKPYAWIIYKAYGDGPVNINYTGNGSAWTAIFNTGNHNFPNGPAYLEFNGFTLDGRDLAVDGFYCNGGHHLRILNNTIKNFGAAGIATLRCDYITAENNMISHVGYGLGWASGITLNSNRWFDTYAGFHNIVANNVISGSYDNSVNHTDGNGIILDLGGTTPPVLVVNNVVYGNGGRCIQALSNTNFWIVNNTCYMNGLDTVANFGSLVVKNASDGYFINNIAVSWNGRPPFESQGSNTNVQYFANMYSGAPNNFSNPQLIQADPLFLSPPLFDPTAAGQFATALVPWLLGNGLTLLPLSPAIGAGIDPSTVPGVPSAIVADLQKYIYRDANGTARPQGSSFDLGAYHFTLIPPLL